MPLWPEPDLLASIAVSYVVLRMFHFILNPLTHVQSFQLLSVRRIAPEPEPIRSHRAAAGLQLSTRVTNLREHLRPSDQIHRTAELPHCAVRRSPAWASETVPPSAARPSDSWLPDDHRFGQRLDPAGLLHPRRCR